MKVAGTSLYPAFTSLLDLAELCARPFFSAFFERGFDALGGLNLVQNIQPRFDVTRFLNFPVLGIKRLNFQT